MTKPTRVFYAIVQYDNDAPVALLALTEADLDAKVKEELQYAFEDEIADWTDRDSAIAAVYDMGWGLTYGEDTLA